MTLLLLLGNAQLRVHEPLPDDHPFYQMIGRVASEWAHVEHVLDLIIWELADLVPQKGACITAQLMGTAPRYRAISTLAQQMGLKKRLVERINGLQGITPNEARNRIIHDPWYMEKTSKRPAQFRSMPSKTPTYGMKDIEDAEITKAIEDIRKLRDKVSKLRADILDEIEIRKKKR
jgi:hypothetical protein